MDSLIIGIQLLLAGVFAVAGVAKLLDLQGSRRAMADFGIPGRLAPAAGTLLPVAELVTAVALVLSPTARAGGVAALVLLLAFSAGIANAMIRGRAPDCNCFGQVHSTPAGARTLARNLVLAGLAALFVGRGTGPSISAWVSARSAAELVAIGLGLATLVLAAVAYRFWSEKRELRAALEAGPAERPPVPKGEPEGLPVGTPAPDFALIDLGGETRTLASLLARGLPVVLEFMDPGCGPCKALLPIVGRWQAALRERVTIAVVTSGADEADRPYWEGNRVSNVLLDEARDVFDSFHVKSTPTAIAIDPDGGVASAPAGGMNMPEVLIRQLIRRGNGSNGATAAASGEPGRQSTEPHIV